MAKLEFLAKIRSFLKEVLIEIKKINWLSRQEVLRYTLIVIGASLTVAVFLGGLDFLFSILIRTFAI